MTLYVILRSESGDEQYAPIGAHEASNDQSAITGFLEFEENGVPNGEKYGEGDYRAVPKRSWAKEPRPIRKKVSFV